MGVSKNRGTPKWMVKLMENPIKMDDLGGFTPLFLETPISSCLQIDILRASGRRIANLGLEAQSPKKWGRYLVEMGTPLKFNIKKPKICS